MAGFAGWLAGSMTVGVVEDFEADPMLDDYEYEMDSEHPERTDSILPAPLRAWRRKDRALRELSTNPWSLLQNETLAMASYRAQIAPWKALWAVEMLGVQL